MKILKIGGAGGPVEVSKIGSDLELTLKTIKELEAV